MGSHELSKESFEEKQIKILKGKIEDLATKNEQLQSDLKAAESVNEGLTKSEANSSLNNTLQWCLNYINKQKDSDEKIALINELNTLNAKSEANEAVEKYVYVTCDSEGDIFCAYLDVEKCNKDATESGCMVKKIPLY